mmetsp:Transcript_2334/g.3267  ORF Transcript_2334/g.3267 Transcript_2334/m.3267 type:complete len:431 (-) Transcript_2334:348-1640(-)|eukprot:CAMPEP_0117745234 /NCGR_PEP_ID=MMETSP0947-20121206/7234_1 /TAXON_ID=44440 /ORGANISM="Chattonella subsalsa, Strain CCMP2191" /LENGTH=430 /DNA_ID=CAMNT_0005562337 /DNA_START=122 /DNA_END=1414 /DNA_ORIENTATION=+
MPDGPSWSFPGRKADRNNNDAPGPGEYNIRGQIGTGSKTMSFGTPSRRNRRVNPAPGPGHYGGQAPERGPAYSFGTKVKVRIRDQSPGPGAYHRNTGGGKKQGPAWSLYGRHNERRGEEMPGPGAYRTDTTEHSRKGGYMGAKQQKRAADNVPGPGAYQMGDQHYKGYGRGPSYSLTGRAKGSSENDVPGPGAYHGQDDPRRSAAHRTYHMHGQDKRFRYRNDGNPGPGEYTLDTTVGKAPAFSLSGRTGRKSRSETPGPGAYIRPQSAPLRRDSSLGRAKRFSGPSQDQVPGPGAYQQMQSTDGKGWSMGARTEYTGKGPDSPGPGAYIRPMSAPMNGSRKNIAFGKDSRFRRQVSAVPGPGAYDPKSPLLSPDKAVTLKGRSKDPRMDNTGEYLLPERTAGGDHAFVGRREWGHGYGGGYSATGASAY